MYRQTLGNDLHWMQVRGNNLHETMGQMTEWVSKNLVSCSTRRWNHMGQYCVSLMHYGDPRDDKSRNLEGVRCMVFVVKFFCDDRLIFLEYRRKTKTCVIEPLILMKYSSQNIDYFTLKMLQSETSKSTFTPITSNGISTVTMWHPALETKISAPTHSICKVQDPNLLPYLFISRGGYPSRHVLISCFQSSRRSCHRLVRCHHSPVIPFHRDWLI